MITKFAISTAQAAAEFGMACQRLVPWAGERPEPPFGAMACFLPATATSAPDCHDQDEVMIVLSGDGTVQIGDESTAVSAGEVVTIARNRTHTVHNPNETTLTWVSVYWPLHEPKAAAPPGERA
jgi:mannose-6-phosphate isomerase-like protein (cupin superfamily)